MKKFVSLLIILVVVGIGGVVGLHWHARSQRVQTTDNAQIEGNVVTLSAEVSGTLKKLLVGDNQRVKKGQLLAEIDSTEYSHKVEQAERALNALQARERAAREQVYLTRSTGEAGIVQGQSGVESALAAVATAQSNVQASRDKASEAERQIAVQQAAVERSLTEISVARDEVKRLQSDVTRYRTLFGKEEVSKQQLEQVETSYRQSRARLAAAQRVWQGATAQVAQVRAGAAATREGVSVSQSQVRETQKRVEEARARLKNALTAPRQVAVAEAQVKVLQAEVKQAKVAVDLARTDLQRTKVYAPVDGTVSKKAVLPGGYVNTGSPILALVQDGVWVVANFKETQMTRIRPGLNVDVEVDSYPGKSFKGRVDSIQPGTGARFSLLPPENAAGSFVKVVQRIPVKIVLDDPNQFTDSPLRPGMSVEATVTL